jgi:hypothetical protein
VFAKPRCQLMIKAFLCLCPDEAIGRRVQAREGTPAGFFLPWDTPELPVEVRREVFLRLSEQIGEQVAAKGVSESEVLDDPCPDRR